MPDINPELLPRSQPADIASCDTPLLFNPPHLATWDVGTWSERDTAGPDPDWSLLTHPAA